MSTLNFIHAIAGNFNAALFSFIKGQEGFVPRIYLDGKNIPTLGVGYALVIRNQAGQWVRRSDAELAQQLGAIGITLTDDPQRLDDDIDILNAAANALNGIPVPPGVPTIAHWNPQSPDPTNTPFSFGTITEPQFQPLFNLLVDDATIKLIAKIGQPTFSVLAGSDEMVALLSMTFNSPNLIGSKLIGALQSGNRAESWYEIRYQSNKERLTDPAIARGIANRRYAESDKFGLYENSLLSESEARTIFRMYTAHSDAIRVYENDARTVPSSTDSFVYESQAARTLLATSYAQFSGAPVVSGEVLVGSSIGEFDSFPGNDLILGEARYNNLHGQGGSDILYGNIVADDLSGEVGADWLFGGLGDDVLNGGADDDHLDGGEGRDTLNGGSGADTLRGGTENDTLIGGVGDDVLEGGMGFDTYKYTSATDGMDTIEDVDGFGTVQFDQKTLTGGFRQSSDPQDTWRSGDGNMTYVKQGANLIVNNTLTIANYGSGDLGIVLAEEGERPTGGLPAINYQNGALTISWMGDEDHNEPTFESPANHFVLGQGGSDVLDLGFGAPQYNHIVWGGFGNDLIYGGGGQDRLYGEEGFDHMDGFGGDDVMYGGFGPDYMMGDTRDSARVALGLGAPGNDYLDGGVGDDIVEGGGGDDILYGGLGDDAVLGDDNLVYAVRPVGNDYLDGGDGHDLLSGGRGDDYMLGGEGNDELEGDNRRPGKTLSFNRVPASSLWVEGARLIFFTAEGGDDYLDGQAGDDVLFGDGGNDILLGGDGKDQLWGDDQDVALVQEGNDWLEGEAGDDQLVGGGGEDALFGGDGDDLIVGDYLSNTSQGASDTLDGGDGDDELQGGGGDDVLGGGAGVDVLFGQDGHDLLDGGEGADQLQGGLGDDGLSGGADNDVLFGEAGADSLFGDEGADDLLGGDGADWLDGGSGDDRLFGELGNDVLSGDAGNDSLFGEEGFDVLIGGDGHDTMSGGLDNDQLVGGRGSDVYLYDLGDGADVIDDMALAGEGNQIQFGTGITLQSLTFLHEEVTQTLTIQVAGGGSVQLIGFDQNAFEYVVDTIRFSSGQQVIIADQLPPLGGIVSANDRDNLIRTGSTDDAISALGGNDLVSAGAGNDQITGGLGNDSLTGGAGQDAYFFNAGDGRDTLIDAAGEGNRLIFGQGVLSGSLSLSRGQGQTLILSTGNPGDQIVFSDTTGQGGSPVDTFELSGGATLTFADLLARGVTTNGTDGADVIDGTASVDVIFAAGGDDVVRAGDGNDVVRGEAGNDSLEGQAGNDVLVGGAGDDQLLGGAGHDTYQFNSGDGIDSISDVITVGESNQVMFGVGLTPESLTLTTVFGQVLVQPGSAFEGVYIGANGSDVLGAHAVDRFEFANGTVLSYADLVARGFDIDGTEFDDFLFGTNVVDRFRGGLGNDRLEGGEGHDAYVFNLGDGVDTIVDVASVDADNEVVFGPGIAASDLQLDVAPDQSDSNLSDLLLRVGSGGDAVQLNTFDRTNVLGPRTVESFHFADGSTLTYDQVLARGFDLTGTEGDDQIAGTNVVDRIVAGDGADVIRSGDGDDTLDGGLGNDRLIGGQGNDTYVFGPGSGQDTVLELQGSQDAIRIAAGVAPSDVVVTRNNDDLVLSLNGGADRLTVSLYFLAAPLRIELVQFADGTVWDQAFLEDLTQPAIAGTGGVDSLTGTSGPDRLAGLAGDDQLMGLAGDDRLDGGTGADQLAGGAGDDTYIVDDAGDVVTELVNEGVDTVQSAVTRTLEAHVENLTLTGNAGINGTSNELDNVLTGNSAANVLTGGLGDDTYVVGAEDTVIEVAGEGADTVQTSVSTTLGANIENLAVTGSASVFGTGNELDNVLQADGSISVLAGGDGNDTYLIGANGDDDILVETATGGIDTVIAAQGYRLPDHIENLTVLDPRVPDFENLSLVPYAPLGPSWVLTAGYGNELSNTLIGGRANNLLDGGLGADTLVGGVGDEIYVVDNIGDTVVEEANEGTDTVESSVAYALSANIENLVLTGTDAVDAIGNSLNNDVRGNAASNVLDGGAGDDSLQGFGGADTYRFGRGAGRDIVVDSSATGEIETIQLASDIAPADIEAYRVGSDLGLVISGTTDEITLSSFFYQPEYAQKQVRFADGTVWNETELRARAMETGLIVGTAGTDTLTLAANARHRGLVGEAGNDILTGGDWDDVLYGDVTFQPFSGNQVIGNDTLLGGAGNDRLIDFRGTNLFDGGAGNDLLVLGTGVDTVLFGRGSGVDVVTFDNNRSDIDIMQMAAGIAPADVVITRRSSALSHIVDLVIPDSGAKVSLALSTDWFAVGSETTQAVVRFGDGTEWSLAWAAPDLPFTEPPLGSSGDNTYSVGDGSEPIVELPGEGVDTVQSTVDYVLPANVENLFLADNFSNVGPFADIATGNALDNLIIGNTRDNVLDGGVGNDVLVGGLFRAFEAGLSETGSDILIGGEGDDVLMADGGNFAFYSIAGLEGGESRDDVVRQADDLFIGGIGNDTYLIHSQQQTVAEFANEGTDTVKSAVSYTLGEHLENLELVSPPLRFDEETGTVIPPAPLNGTGNGLDNLIIGSGDDNVLSGLAGRDTLWGGYAGESEAGPAGSGNDTLIGGIGDDTYLYKIGDGIDTIQDVATVGEGNRVQFGVGISQADLGFTEDTVARTLTIHVGASGTDQLLLTNFDPTGANGSLVVDTLAFADGSTASLASFFGPAITEGDDTITTGAGDDVINALGGNDIVDTGAGNDTITGGTGIDALTGGSGDDTYLFNAGDGVDTITDTAAAGEGNTVEFGAGIAPPDLTLDRGSLLIRVGTNGDAIHVTPFDPTDALGPHAVDTFRFADGTTLSYSQLLARGFDLTGTAGDDTITGTNVVDRITGLAGNDTIQASVGNDSLTGGTGDDTYVYNLGDGLDTIEDTSSLGEGNQVQFGAGITQGDVTFTRDEAARTLTIQVGSSGTDQLRLANFDPTGANGSVVVDTLGFADGSTLNLADLFVNHAPTVATPLVDQTVPEDAPFSLVIPANTFADQDAGDVLTLSASLADDSALPAWLSLNATTATFSGTPDDAQVGSVDLKVTATDRENASVSDVFTLIVTNVNDAPTIANPIVDQSVSTGDALTFAVPTNTFADIDTGETLTYSATLADGTALPSWLTFNSATRTFSGTPGEGDAGVVSLTVTATDTGNLSVADLFDLTVTIPNLVLTGTAGHDVLTGGAGHDQLFGMAGNDTLNGAAGSDLLDGGAGADTMAGGTGHDTYVVESFFDGVTEAANAGIDTVQSSLLTYTLGANVENLTLTGAGPSAGIGNALSNQLVGNSGANLLDGKGGADTMAGGAGNDLYMVDHAGDTVVEQANEGALDSVTSSVSYSLSANVENLVLTGSAAINGTGNDVDNILTGNSAANVLTGGAGNDTYVIGTGDTVVEAANEGTDTVVSGLTHTLSINVENLTLAGFSAINGTGNALDNVLNGRLNLAGNTLTGGAGNDTYILGSGDQVVEAANGGTDSVQSVLTHTLGANVEHLTLTGIGAVNGTGNGLNNTLIGNRANNTLSGSGGNDTVRGGLGNDTVNGGSGNDTFLFGRGEGQDLIQDNSGTADKILYDAGINPLDLVISRQANNLRLAIHGSSDRITVQNWYTSAANRTETIQAGNGQMLLSTQVDQLIQAMASFTTQTGLTWDQAIDQRPQEVQTVLAASWQ